MRDPQDNTAPVTRLIAMGSAALMEGFALVGFETWPDADERQLQAVLEGLLQRRERALVLLEPELARCECRALRQVLNEGGRIVVTEVPPLNDPAGHQPALERLLVSTFGAHAQEGER